ncbi:hypothetical protein CAOG_08284 [Capsaspora owczarzaki ATCC 30864]|uniref:hypothetical protein n=1 Tax=Capsaspora owczarzaki (strain ATCC 30864) TaxID=595528 RepID=UPI0001FE2854|nr:hypothetical protein CAOG_08284 [Capsaspora owczarzaki ATCC 30864]|eukprot:XP_004342007.1 hypothetical protein CAOG_08284 [Capsaspora owczarzaki ATCC 30864]
MSAVGSEGTARQAKIRTLVHGPLLDPRKEQARPRGFKIVDLAVLAIIGIDLVSQLLCVRR